MLAAGLWPSVAARADDVRVESDTAFQVYEVRSPGTAALLARRRLVQSLGMTWARPLDDDEGGGQLVPRLAASLRLRLDQDFGEDCLIDRDLCYAATRSGDPAFYQPLADDTEVDATEAWVEVNGLPLGARVRAGRHLRFDNLGFVRMDGATGRVEPAPWVAAEVYAGALVRSTSLAGSDAFVPQGDPRLDLDVDPERVPFVDPPDTTWLAGGSVELGRVRWARARVGFREVRESAGLVARRASVALASEPVDALRLEAAGVWDVLEKRWVDATAGLSIEPGRSVGVRATVERHVPVFDWGTIWAYFDRVPVDEARLGATWRVTDRLELGAAGRARRAAFEDREDEADLGVEGHVRARVAGFRLQVSGFSWGGDLGPVAAVLLDAARPLASWVLVELRASAWHFDDPLREGLYGTSLSEAAAVALEVTEATTLRLSLEHAYSRVVGNRFRALAALTFEVWR